MCKELESDVLPLLCKTPNHRNNIGENRECFMFKHDSKSPTHLKMYRFLGGFLANALMTGAPFTLNLAPAVWK